MTALEANPVARISAKAQHLFQPEGLRKQFLMRFHNIGLSRAEKLLSHFGEDLPRVLADYDSVVEELVPFLSKFLPNLGPRLALQMHVAWPAAEAEWSAMAWLEEHGVAGTDAVVARRIIGLLGERAVEVLNENPYTLVSILSWSRADRIGIPVLENKHGLKGALEAPERLLGALERLWSDRRQRGHTAASMTDLRNGMERLLGSRELAKRAIHHALIKQRLFYECKLARPPGCRFMENRVLERLEAWREERRYTAAEISLVLDTVSQRNNLHPEQRHAIEFALGQRASVIAGSAGTGKSTTALALVEAWEILTGGNVEMATLSGKAAQVLSKKTKRLARTIYRLLRELREGEDNAPEQPELIRYNQIHLGSKSLVLIDEASMPALGDWAEIIDWVERRGASICLLGDSGQLPPIGPGLVFHLLAGDDRYATRLTTIHRQTEASGIPVVAQAIRSPGRSKLQWNRYAGKSDGVFLLDCSDRELLEQAESVITDLGGFPAQDHSVQILAARNETVGRFNHHFHDAYRAGQPYLRGTGGQSFSAGDPVVHTVNDYKRGLFNGVLGYVTGAQPHDHKLTCEFMGEIYEFDEERLGNISLSYALTAHKMQGSQAERVIVLIEPSLLIEPTWLYTAITRAERQVIIVGATSDLVTALKRKPAFLTRNVGFRLSGCSINHATLP
ncbi:MAG: AAA family ATPase [Alphaproteobacteria bacterium]|nr:AAA family ATPase [Alphaproteobacteria bacterium]